MNLFVYESICAGAFGQASESLVREGRAMLSAIVADFQKIRAVTVVTLLAADTPFALGDRCVRVEPGRELAQFCELAGRADGTMVIAPEFEGMLRQRSQDVLDAGGRLLGSSPDAIALAGDKYAASRHFTKLGLNHPNTTLADAKHFEDKRCPFILKPRNGAGSQATFLVRDSKEKKRIWRQAMAEWPSGDFVIQDYATGRSASVAVLAGPEEFIILPPAWQRLSDDGRFRYLGGSVPITDAACAGVEHVASVIAENWPNLNGYFGIDFVLSDQATTIIEINPRLTTSYIGLRKLCRSNLAQGIVDAAMGKPICTLEWSEGVVSFDSDGNTHAPG